jgi:UDP-N-acetylglucosamine diphosphorylase/glucosamine-1-phosphate N-acetyltransferase
MNILLDDLPFNNRLFPFASVKSMAHIRIGILSIFEKWQFYFPGKVLIGSEQNLYNSPANSFIKFPANIIPSVDFLKKLQEDENFSFTDDCKKLECPWQIFEYNDWAIRQDFEMITEGRTSQRISNDNHVLNVENIFIESGAKISHSILNAETGPIYIDKNAEILEGSLVRGPFALCEGSRMKMGTKIYGATTIGPYCLAGGEIKNSILMNYSNKAHDGYLGDSVIGNWCNLGAGTSNSNLKNTAGVVKVWSKEKKVFIDAGNKCGLLMGDYSRCAINTSFNTGTVVGTSCNIFGNNDLPKFIDDFTWGNENYIFEKSISDINNWKKLKGLEITEEEIALLKNIYKTKNIQ